MVSNPQLVGRSVSMYGRMSVGPSFQPSGKRPVIFGAEKVGKQNHILSQLQRRAVSQQTVYKWATISW